MYYLVVEYFDGGVLHQVAEGPAMIGIFTLNMESLGVTSVRVAPIFGDIPAIDPSFAATKVEVKVEVVKG